MKNWPTIDTAPKDGIEFITCNTNQGNVFELVSWNGIHKFWQSKGRPIHMQATHWWPIEPIRDLAPVVVPKDADADEMNRRHGEAFGVDWKYAE